MKRDLYQDALDAVSKLFGDMDASKEETKRSLKALIGEIEVMIDTL